MKYLFEDTFELDQSVSNLNILFEDGEVGSELSFKVQRWAQESSTTVKHSIIQKIGQIIARIKQLFGLKAFRGKGDTRILVDITGFNKLARFISGTTTYRVANFGPGDVSSYAGHINMANTYLGNKPRRQAEKLAALYRSMKGEMNSDKAKLVNRAAMESKFIHISNTKAFRVYIVPFIRNMLLATKKLNGMVTKMYKSFENLMKHTTTLFRKMKMQSSSANARYQKSDLMGRCVTYVAYANKLLVTTCQNAIDRINRIIESYYNEFAENNEA